MISVTPTKTQDVRRDVIRAAIEAGIEKAGSGLVKQDADALRVVGALAIQVGIGASNVGGAGCPASQAGLWDDVGLADEMEAFAAGYDSYMSSEGYNGFVLAQVID
jgi:hypothetical protein